MNTRLNKTALDEKSMLQFYASMKRIRRVEETLMALFSQGVIPGFLHVCIGQEASPVAVSSLLEDTDYIGSTHRGHGHVLAKGVDLKRFMAEIFGRKDGCCLGRSGSMHLADKDKGVLGANGIVGGGIPIAVGASLAAKYKYPGRVVVVYFGEGAADQGTFHECMNMASLWDLPIIFLCESNGWSQFTPKSVHMKSKCVADRAGSYGIPFETLNNDVIEIHHAAEQAINRARAGEGPTLLEIKCNRWFGHYVGDQQKYRDKKFVSDAQNEDCLQDYVKQLKKKKILDAKHLKETDDQIESEIQQAVDFAQNSPAPEADDLIQGLYV